MKVNIITLFPEMFTPLRSSIMKKANTQGSLSLNLIQLRDFAINKYGQVDDTPYGGESGMVIRPEPLADAINSLELADRSPVLFMTPQGRPLKQSISSSYSKCEEITIICGHYKGIDERIREKYITDEISLGDFILTGGEIPAMAFVDSIIRLLPDVLGHESSGQTDSFTDSPLLGWPVYTRPSSFEKMNVPAILLSGHHKNIEKWRLKQRETRTQEKRPDIWDVMQKKEHNK